MSTFTSGTLAPAGELDAILNTWLNSIQTSHPNVFNKVTSFTDEEKKFAFMFDFEKDLTSMNRLNSNNGQLIDDWSEFEHLMIDRKKITVLESYRRFRNKPHEIEHVTLVKNKRLPPSFDPAAGHGYNNIVSGEILNPNTSGLPIDMRSIITDQKNGHITYKPMWFKIPSDCTIPSNVTNNLKEFPIGSGNWYKKKVKNTIWNPNWNNQRIKEEISYVWANKRIQRLQRNTGYISNQGVLQNEIVYISSLTDGTEVIIKHNNVANQFGNTYTDILSYLELKL